jgi:hypothetical protein
MRLLALILKISAPVFLLVGFMHLTLGLRADVLLGATVPIEAISDAALDSQNRFYGVAFSLYGVLLYLCATDIPRYATVLRCLLVVFFLAGCARFVSIALHGTPPPLIVLLLGSELILPPFLGWWLHRVEHHTRQQGLWP